MMKQVKKWILPAGLFLVFAVLTVLVKIVDVQVVNPEVPAIGFATLNKAVFHAFGGYHAWLYQITDLFGFAAFGLAFVFACVGGLQLLKRKSFFKVDFDIYMLAVVYILNIAAYVIFEFAAVNYRPVLMEGEIAASYPSSHSMTVVAVFGTALFQIWHRIKNKVWRNLLMGISSGIILFTVVGRMFCGAHWFTDILAGLVYAGALITLYRALTGEK